MEPAEQLQAHEITALQSIYGDDFIECPPPKAWKGATRLQEFIIHVPYPDPKHAHQVNLSLNVKFPKTYPTLAPATFTIQKPLKGLSQDQIVKLGHAVNAEAQRLKGVEMVMDIVEFIQQWLQTNVTPPIEMVGSLALQMNQRAMDEEKARQLASAKAAMLQLEEEERAAQKLGEEIQADAEALQKLMMEKEEQHRLRRARAGSSATEVPRDNDMQERGGDYTPTETFQNEIEISGIRFRTVKLFHARTAGLGTVYSADPVCDEVIVTLPIYLELYVVTFESEYYSSTQGRRKLLHLEKEIQRLTTIRHANLISVFGVKLYFPHSPGHHSHLAKVAPQIMILTEKAPSLTMRGLIGDSELREERVSDYLGQLLSALNAIHSQGLVHRGITTRCIYLSERNSDDSTQSKLLKLGKVGYHVTLLDLHRSNSFGPNIPPISDEVPIPEAWLSRDVKQESSLLYTQHRDIHDVGIVLLQMLMGQDVTERFSNVHAAISASAISPALARIVTTALVPSKKNPVTAVSLLGDLAGTTFPSPTTARTQPISFSRNSGPRTPVPTHLGSSPEQAGYFSDIYAGNNGIRHVSRWKEDWEELELLGRGAFGSVVKARNKIDNRIYAVKKVRLKTSDSKIFREVNALSRLSHRFIVRYYTTWFETAEPQSTAASDDSSTDNSQGTSVPIDSSERYLPGNGGFAVNMEDLDNSVGRSMSSFPSIHFASAPGSPGASDSSGSEEEEYGSPVETSGGQFQLFTTEPSQNGNPFYAASPSTPARAAPLSRTLYIQMEFVERQTLKELVDDGISEDEAWRLFQQILDALVHMSTLGILHRDIKLTNIFIDAKGDCKVGDFGLATSSLAAVEPSDLSVPTTTPEAEMTLEVGTRLYIAPEVQVQLKPHSKANARPKSHSKADMYSLGIVFFEMNYRFSTGSERIAVLEDLRKPSIIFPSGWDSQRTRQEQIIRWLLRHDPDERPTALELSQSSLLPTRLEEEYFKGALRMMAKPDSPHHAAVLSSLFSQPPRPSRGFLYDADADPPEHAALNNNVGERLAAIFRLHGAVDMEPPLLMPLLNPEEEKDYATFIDRHGDVVALPNDLLAPFARLASRTNIKRIKRYHIANIYRPNPVAGHPKVQKAAVFDIITQDLQSGPLAAGAEIITVADEILESFPNLAQNYDIHISHTKIIEIALNHIPDAHRSAVMEILSQTKASVSQKRTSLLKRGLLRSIADELEILSEITDDIDDVEARLEKVSPSFAALLKPSYEELKSTLKYAASAGVSRTIFFHPLMLGNYLSHFKDGIVMEVVKRNKRTDVLAAGGRYDNIISHYSPSKHKMEAVCAMGIQISVEKITTSLALYQSTSVRTLVNEERSFGFWSPRRCDVYVVSSQPEHLQERLEVVSYLWKHNISADIMYESALQDAKHENHRDICKHEGILFTVYPRTRAERKNHPAFKVKSILKKTEHELTRQELVGFLQQQIAEQKRVDLGTSGASVLSDVVSNPLSVKEAPVSPDIQLILPTDAKKQRKQIKSLFAERAFEKGVQIQSTFQGGMPTIGVDVPSVAFEAMIRSSAWLTDEEAWKAIISFLPSQHSYAQQIRDAVLKRKSEGHHYILLYAVREERIQLLCLT